MQSEQRDEQQTQHLALSQQGAHCDTIRFETIAMIVSCVDEECRCAALTCRARAKRKSASTECSNRRQKQLKLNLTFSEPHSRWNSDTLHRTIPGEQHLSLHASSIIVLSLEQLNQQTLVCDAQCRSAQLHKCISPPRFTKATATVDCALSHLGQLIDSIAIHHQQHLSIV